MTFSLFACNAALVFALMGLLWIVSVVRRDASIVDPWWSIGFLIVAVFTAVRTGVTPAKVLLLVLVSVWAVRLWAYLLYRSIGKPEDPRYAAFRRRFGPKRYWWVSLFQVFVLQGALILIISTPLVISFAASGPDPVSARHLLVGALFAIGFLVETVSDVQLQVFRSDPTKRGQVLDTGLFRFSRHPNYFGEAVLWWGFWVASTGQPLGWASVYAPALMTFLLVKVSGVAMLDAHLTSTRPGYADYIRRTSGFIPRPPKRN